MKTRFLFTVFLLHNLFMACVQYNKSESTVRRSIDYVNIEAGWTYKNDEWFYYDKSVNLSPIIYTSIETIDSTCVYNQSKKKYEISVHTQSAGFYDTSEPNWKWDDKGWRYKEKYVKSFPPSFTGKITKTVATEDLLKNKVKNEKTITIDDSYQVEDKKWVWGTEENCWLLNGNVTDLLPPYVRTKSTKKEITQSKF